MKIETRSQAYKRITDGLRKYFDQDTATASELLQEAKRTEVWKEKWASFKEWCEKEFGKSKQRAYQLLQIAATIDEIQGVKPFDSESDKNKGILHNLGTRQVVELKGLAPAEKAKVLSDAIKTSGGKSPTPATIAKARFEAQLPPRRSSFDPDERPRDYSGAYSSPKDEIDPADKT